MINKSDSRCAVVRICYHSYDYRLNWTPLSPITITEKLKFSHVLLTFQATVRYCRDLQTKSNMFCIIRAPSQTQSQRIVIHLSRNADKGGGVLMSIILPNLNHSFISPVPRFRFRFRIRIRIRISWFSIRPD